MIAIDGCYKNHIAEMVDGITIAGKAVNVLQ